MTKQSRQINAINAFPDFRKNGGNSIKKSKITLFSIVAILIAAVGSNWAMANPITAEHQTVSRQFDALKGVPGPVKNGVQLIGIEGPRKIGEWIQPGRMICSGSFKEGRVCHDTSPKRVEKWQTRKTYEIIDRSAYVSHKRSVGAKIGTALGLGVGVLAALAFVLSGGMTLGGYIVFSLFWPSVGALGGMLNGRGLAEQAARRKPRIFPTTETYTKEYPI